MRLTQEIDGADLETVPCDLCGSEDYGIWARARGNTLSICHQCGLVWTNPRLRNREFKDKKLYDRGYFFQQDRFTERQKRGRATVHRLEREKIESIVPGGRILDVGCGMGTFLEGFGAPWEKHGCDISSFGLEEATRRGVKTYHGEFERLDFGDLPFDVVSLRASLHHTYSPRRCLERAHALLRPGGLVAIAMSTNRDGPMGKLFKGHVKCYDQTVNYLFSTLTLHRYLENAGFIVRGYSYPYFGTGYDSVMDWIEIAPRFGCYLFALLTGAENSPRWRDLASPPFHANYLNIYAEKP